MTLPRFLARFNRRFTNPAAVKRGSWPVLVHTGRTSGTTYRTPLDVHAIDGGYLFIANYGSSSDWVRNVLAAGRATLLVDGERTDLDRPRLIAADEAWDLAPQGTRRPPRFVGVVHGLAMSVAVSDPVDSQPT